jgi:hypothetical protein
VMSGAWAAKGLLIGLFAEVQSGDAEKLSSSQRSRRTSGYRRSVSQAIVLYLLATGDSERRA